MQFEAYLRRSKFVPLEVQLRKPYFCLFQSLALYTSRLAALTVRVSDSSDFGRIVQHLRSPIPTLRKFAILGSHGMDRLELPSGIGNNHFMHVKELRLENISLFQVSRAFPHVTELTWHVGPCGPVPLSRLLDALEQLPVLERVYLMFRTSQYTATNPSSMITLPHVQEMLLCSSEGIPPILGFLKLPNLARLVVDTVPELPSPSPALPVTSFAERFPNFAELPEMAVYTRSKISRVGFRSPSQAALEYPAIARETAHCRDRRHWGGLPLHSVRRLVATLDMRAKGVEDVWLVRLLRDLGSLEHLELEGYCGGALRRLRRLIMRGDYLPGIKTLTVRSGAYEIRQAMRLKGVTDGLGLEITVTCIPDPESDANEWPPDADGLSEDWNLSDGGESDDDSM
jgi:hypothetical protein